MNLTDALKGSACQAEITAEAYTRRFHEGTVHRYPGMPTMIEASGTHYEMGLQYGTLLLPEIRGHLITMGTLLEVYAAAGRVTPEAFLDHFVQAAAGIAQNLPDRFHAEFRGIAEGSGLPIELVTAFALTYDVFMAGGCTGLLMRTSDGGIIHGRTNDTDTFGGIEFAKNYLIVRLRPQGYRTVTHISYPLNPGITNGCSASGLAFSEETLYLRNPNPRGHSISYLARTWLEERDSMEGFEKFLDEHPRIGGYGAVWSDRNAGEGYLYELMPERYAKICPSEPLFWNMNHVYTEELQSLEIPQRRIFSDDDREEAARAFTPKAHYSVEDAVAFLRLHKDSAGRDMAAVAHRKGVANEGTTMMTIFDPAGDGLYFAFGPSFASCQTVYHLAESFHERPQAVVPGEPLDPAVVLVGAAAGRLQGPQALIGEYEELLLVFRDKPQIHYRIAEAAGKIGELGRFACHASAAAAMDPDVPEYRIAAGQAALAVGDRERARDYVLRMDESRMYARERVLRLKLLIDIGLDDDAVLAGYAADVQAILTLRKAEGLDLQS